MFAINKHNDLWTPVFWGVYCPDFRLEDYTEDEDSGLLQSISACTEFHGVASQGTTMLI
jgi:hypothetical protein